MSNILIIDDNEIIRLTLETILEDDGYTVYSSSNATESIKLLEEMEIKLAIVDIHIPDMEGSTLIKRINDINPNIKVIIYTGDNTYIIPDNLLALGINQNNLLFKPVMDFSILTEKIEILLSKNLE